MRRRGGGEVKGRVERSGNRGVVENVEKLGREGLAMEKVRIPGLRTAVAYTSASLMWKVLARVV